jgi:hypothetical protein
MQRIALLSAVVLLGAFIGHRISPWLCKGSGLRRYFVGKQIDAALALPGIVALLMPLITSPADEPQGWLATSPFLIAFSAAYVAARLPHEIAQILGYRRRADTLPYETWYSMLGTDTAVARQLLRAHFVQLDAQRVTGDAGTTRAQLRALNYARARLAKMHGADPLLPSALSTLDAKIQQLDHEIANSGKTLSN